MIFTKENILDIQLSIIKILDLKNVEILDYYRRTGSEVGPDLTYEIVDDNTISIDYGWCDYEEHENNTAIINFLYDTITVLKVNDGYSVYGGEYDNSDEMVFEDSDKLIEWLIEEI